MCTLLYKKGHVTVFRNNQSQSDSFKSHCHTFVILVKTKCTGCYRQKVSIRKGVQKNFQNIRCTIVDHNGHRQQMVKMGNHSDITQDIPPNTLVHSVQTHRPMSRKRDMSVVAVHIAGNLLNHVYHTCPFFFLLPLTHLSVITTNWHFYGVTISDRDSTWSHTHNVENLKMLYKSYAQVQVRFRRRVIVGTFSYDII